MFVNAEENLEAETSLQNEGDFWRSRVRPKELLEPARAPVLRALPVWKMAKEGRMSKI